MVTNKTNALKSAYSYKSTNESTRKFRFWHVEALLNQSADLLDRCLRERGEARSLLGKFRDVQDELSLDEIREKNLLEDQRRSLEDDIQRIVYQTEPEDRAPMCKREDALSKVMKNAEKLYNQRMDPGNAMVFDGAGANHEQASMEVTLLKKQKEAASSSLTLKLKAIKDFKNYLKERRQATSNDGPLSYGEQAHKILERVSSDYADAIDRLTKAEEGLGLLYGYAPPSSVSAISDLDSAILWVRAAIRWVAVFAQLDQGFTISASVRSLVKDNEWTEFTKALGKEGSANIDISIPPALFSSHAYVRLRGVSAFVSGSGLDKAPWSACLSVPMEATSRQVSIENVFGSLDVSTPLQEIDIPQDDVPPCALGRIETRMSSRLPEICGAVSLMNASPIGKSKPKQDKGNKWAVFVQTPDRKKISIPQDYDFQLELSLVGRPLLLRKKS